MVRYPSEVNGEQPKITRETAGLCAECANARRVESSHGSVFLLCELSQGDPRFVKYPRLPVLSCAGYKPKPKVSDAE